MRTGTTQTSHSTSNLTKDNQGIRAIQKETAAELTPFMAVEHSAASKNMLLRLTRYQQIQLSHTPLWNPNHPTTVQPLALMCLLGKASLSPAPTCSPFALGTTLLSSMSHLFPNSILSTSSLACYNEIRAKLTHLPQPAASIYCTFVLPDCLKCRLTLTGPAIS